MEMLLIIGMLLLVLGVNLAVSSGEYEKYQQQALRRTHRDFF